MNIKKRKDFIKKYINRMNIFSSITLLGSIATIIALVIAVFQTRDIKGIMQEAEHIKESVPTRYIEKYFNIRILETKANQNEPNK
jgi:hypothetical protein